MPTPSSLAARSVATFVGLAGVTVALVWLFLSMRAVMAIGGSCASGGPYAIANPCPHATWLTTLGAIIGGVLMAAIYTVFGLRTGPRITVLVWSALFVSLGWNFLDFGLRAAPGSGAKVGWLVCAGLFAILGATPLAGLFSRTYAHDLFWSDGDGLPVGLRSGRRPASPAPPSESEHKPSHPPRSQLWRAAPTPPPTPPADDLATALEKLAALHDTGKLSDDEYANVKQRLLEDQ
jgi:hypothetical protein